MSKKYFAKLKLLLFLLTLFLLPIKNFGQCAGLDSKTSICDIPNPASQSINLFALLDGNPTAGGTWTDDDFSQGLDRATGILNAQLIRESGFYRFTYTVSGVTGCVDNSATITVAIGGYAGISGPTGAACTDATAYDLFHVFNGAFLSPQSNGKWYNNTINSPVNGSIIDPKDLGVGTYQFTYSIPAIGDCAGPVSSIVSVTVYRAPEAGNPSNLLLCDSDDLSIYSNLDLNDQLSGEDPNGQWTDNENTGEITSRNDHFVDVQKIYETHGEGIYTFTYTVSNTPHPICKIDFATVRIRIEKRIDLTGATLVVSSDICEPDILRATYSAKLTSGAKIIPNGQYNVTYKISGPSSETRTELLTINNGSVTFSLPSIFFQKVGQYKIEIKEFNAFETEGACVTIINNLSDDLTIHPIPKLDSAKIKIDPVCQNKSALVQITGASSLPNGRYSINYKVTGANNTNAQVASITVANGATSFIIPSTLTAKDGSSLVVITNITNTLVGCTNTANVSGNMVVNPLPNSIDIKIEIKDYCLNEPVPVSISGLGTLKNITILYTISGSNLAPTQIITLAVSSGKASFVIPQNLLANTGATRVTITKVTNNETTCDIVPTGLFDDFLINTIPIAPATSLQIFCKSDGATVANLVPNGTQYKWYDSVTAITPLSATTVLVSGNYYVKETALSGGCVSPANRSVVTINDIAAPVLKPKGQEFCGINNPTIADLSNNTNASASIVWYDAQDNGNQLTNATLLQDNTIYYGFDFSTTTNCFSNDVLIAKVSLTNCSTTEYADFFIPDGFSPNGDGTNDTYAIPDIDFLYPDYTLEIYNRYGNLMFKGNKNKPDWDGKNSDSKIIDGVAPNGVYFYVVHFNKDNRPPLQGRLYLNR
ncbi:gliding motility-associated C-terminal domain-containing protein [Flavobacterium sp. 140616W15]|uniref:gliding motility-associated C-terminal domain-containing protein n=1 Tax=Flavobacterium sp. 140616W15 TaxID=2478552 RepID=UPI000F0BE96B|nr:gliding motility-associated C-terminal domain-containing protein [Flavobacterium sp. 140616W15]AYN03064.1 gliding motility-associated C-terminal domain-containing protein [Flavobacterium sp. 140616W15]